MTGNSVRRDVATQRISLHWACLGGGLGRETDTPPVSVSCFLKAIDFGSRAFLKPVKFTRSSAAPANYQGSWGFMLASHVCRFQVEGDLLLS
jgi:hypothetical protein